MIEPARAAFLLIDMQMGFISPNSPLCIAGAAATVPACARALNAAREGQAGAIYHVRRVYQPDGSDVEAVRYRAWVEGGRPLSVVNHDSMEAPAELSSHHEAIIIKPSFSAFFRTDLDGLLRDIGITTVVLAGTTTPNCIRSTAYDALELGYNVVVIEDATSSRTPEAQAANLADMAAVGIQLITSEQYAAGALSQLEDTEAEVARLRAADTNASVVDETEDTENEPEATSILSPDLLVAPQMPIPSLDAIETVSTGWINKYLLHYTMPDGAPYTYESVSRKKPDRYAQAMERLGQGEAPVPDAICIVPLLRDKVMLIREFRYPLNSWCISFPAGLIEPGESLEEAVNRELMEETGYRVRTDIDRALLVLPQPGFSSTGLAEESVQVVLAQVEAAGDAAPEPSELIEPFILERDQVGTFLDLNTVPIGTRCQLVLEMLSNI